MKEVIPDSLLGMYVNADEVEKSWRQSGFIDFATFGVTPSADEALNFFSGSDFLMKSGMSLDVSRLRCCGTKLVLDVFPVTSRFSYLASVASDFIRHKLLEQCESFTFETVMSSPDKVQFLRKAKASGYRVYLYYVATEDPEINISRVAYRVKMLGHNVPKVKIIERYYRSSTCWLTPFALQTGHIFLIIQPKTVFGWQK